MTKVQGELLLAVPEIGAAPALLADWLELTAFLSAERKAHLNQLMSNQDLQWDTQVEDASVEDEILEDTASIAAGEIERRGEVLDGAYPFQMSVDGRFVVMNEEPECGVGYSIYLFCLIVDHAKQSQIVPVELTPTLEEMREARNLFQVCATLAAAGYCIGPAFSLGFPRPDGSGFLKKIAEIWRYFKDGKPREKPLAGSADVKDEGIDVVAWRPQRDSLPGTLYLLGQAASGHSWQGKSVKDHITVFHHEWFEITPATQATPALFVPEMLDEEDFLRRITRSHGQIFHRGRLPLDADRAPDLAKAGVGPIERIDDIADVKRWLLDYRKRIRPSGAI
jgi:hypothetical protein